MAKQQAQVTAAQKAKGMIAKAAVFAQENWREIAVAAVTVAIVEDLDDIADLVD
jgi:hypothetical protein